MKLLPRYQRMHRFVSAYQRSHPVVRQIPCVLRLAIISFSVLLILANVAALVILFTFDSESARFISGGDPRQFYRELQVDLLDDYGEVSGIAHNAGNRVGTTLEALAYGADIIEIDVVLVQDQLHAAHWSPFRFIGDRFFRGPTLAEVWGTAAQAEAIKLDLRNASKEMVSELVGFLGNRQSEHIEVIAVSEKPGVLALLGQQLPDVTAMLSVSDHGFLHDLLSDEDLLNLIDGVSVNEILLDATTVTFLEEKGLIIFAWTVNDPSRMNELIEYGINGITTDNLAILDLLGERERVETTGR